MFFDVAHLSLALSFSLSSLCSEIADGGGVVLVIVLCLYSWLLGLMFFCEVLLLCLFLFLHFLFFVFAGVMFRRYLSLLLLLGVIHTFCFCN